MSCPTKSTPRAAIAAAQLLAVGGAGVRRRRPAARRAGRRVGKRRDREDYPDRQHAIAFGRLAAPPGRDVGHGQVLAKQAARQASAGTRAARAIRRRPEPGMFSTATPPERMASSRPGTPKREAALSSRGSHHSASTRRGARRALRGRRWCAGNTRPSRTPDRRLRPAESRDSAAR